MAHLSKKGGRGESFTHPQGRSQSLASDLPLKEGNLGEGERNMFEQSESDQREQRVDTSSTSPNTSTFKAGPSEVGAILSVGDNNFAIKPEFKAWESDFCLISQI